MVCYDTSGKEIWAKSANDKVSFSYDIGVDGGDNIYITGHSFGLTLGNKSMDGVYIGKYNSAGTSVWGSTNATIIESSRSTCIAVNKDGSSCIAGIFNGDFMTFGTTKLANTSSIQGFDVFIAKLADK